MKSKGRKRGEKSTIELISFGNSTIYVDSHNFILSFKGKKSYFSELETLFVSLLNKKIKQNEKKTIVELLDAIINAKNDVIQTVKMKGLTDKIEELRESSV